MYAFTYEAPTSTAAAAAQAAAGARPIAGGQSLLPSLRLRLADPGQLVDLGRIPELAGIRKEGDHIVIGAMARHQQVADSAEGARHAGRLAGQQRPRRLLPERRAGAGCHHRHQPKGNRGR